MDSKDMTSDEIDYINAYVERRRKGSRGWKYMRYFLLFWGLFLLGISYYSYQIATSSFAVGMSFPLLSPTADNNTVETGELLYACSIAKDEALIQCMLWVSCILCSWASFSTISLTVSRWNRHIEDNILKKLVGIMLVTIGNQKSDI